MKKLLAFAVGAALFAGGGAVFAAPIPQPGGGFSIDSTRTAGTGPLAGFDIIRFLAINNGVGDTAGTTKLQSIKVTMSILNPGGSSDKFKIDFRDVDNDFANDANLLGSGIAPASPAASFIRVGSLGTFNAVLINPPGAFSDPSGDGTPDIDPTANPAFSDLKSFRVDGFNSNAPTATPAVGGALFAAAVVPTGKAVNVTGSFAAEGGSSVNFNYSDPVPEPTSLALIGLAGMGLLGRRRRRTA